MIFWLFSEYSVYSFTQRSFSLTTPSPSSPLPAPHTPALLPPSTYCFPFATVQNPVWAWVFSDLFLSPPSLSPFSPHPHPPPPINVFFSLCQRAKLWLGLGLEHRQSCLNPANTGLEEGARDVCCSWVWSHCVGRQSQTSCMLVDGTLLRNACHDVPDWNTTNPPDWA